MRQTLQIIDDLLPSGIAKELRQHCLKLPFGPVEYKGATYPNICILDDNWTGTIMDLMQNALESQLEFHLSFLRYSIEGEDTPQWIHADNGEAQFAAVFYLSEPSTEEDGTAFWYNRDYASDQAEYSISATAAKALQSQSHSSEGWDMVGLARQRFNRLIVYPTKLFHSRYPQYSQGKDLESGRLIWVAFFDKA